VCAPIIWLLLLLIKIFQGLPNLCWFKSDLTQENNITILQHNCPDITFAVQNKQVEQSATVRVKSSRRDLLPLASASTGFIAEASKQR
jgi:hypothetical protein